MSNARYGTLPVRYELDDMVFSSESLVSVFGAKIPIQSSEKASLLCRNLKKSIITKIGKLNLRARIVHETSKQGETFNLRFEDLTSSNEKELRALINQSAVQEPWERREPRLVVNKLSESTNAPALVVVYFHDQVEIMKVNDFNSVGIQLSTTKDSSLGLVVGDRFTAEFLTRMGGTISSFQGKVARTSEEWIENEEKLALRIGVEVESVDQNEAVRFKRIVEVASKS